MYVVLPLPVLARIRTATRNAYRLATSLIDSEGPAMSVPAAVSTPPLLAASKAGAIVFAVVAPLGPLLMTLYLFITPASAGDDVTTGAEKIMASPASVQWSLLLLMLAAMFGSLGSLVVASGIRRGAPRFGAIAAVIAFVGWIVAGYPGVYPAVAAAPAAGLSQEQTLALIAGIDGQVQSVVFGALFACLWASSLLFGIAALIASRRGRYPLWVAILLTACMPLVVAGSLLPGKGLAVGWIVVTVAYAAAGMVYARGFRNVE